MRYVVAFVSLLLVAACTNGITAPGVVDCESVGVMPNSTRVFTVDSLGASTAADSLYTVTIECIVRP